MNECYCEYGKDEVNDIDDILLIKCNKCIKEDLECEKQHYYEQERLFEKEEYMRRQEEQN